MYCRPLSSGGIIVRLYGVPQLAYVIRQYVNIFELYNFFLIECLMVRKDVPLSPFVPSLSCKAALVVVRWFHICKVALPV